MTELSAREESQMIVAHQAGMNYYHVHRMFAHLRAIPVEQLASVAQSCGFHGRECEAWLAGFDGARRRAIEELERPGGCGALRRVVWEIDIDATTPEDAAREALAIMRDPTSIATVFSVDGEQIDLLDDAIAELERPGGCGAARLAVIWTAKSRNRKTGPMPVSTISSGTCPRDCAMRVDPVTGKDGPCYAKHGRLGFLWRMLDRMGPLATWMSGIARVTSTDWRGYCASVAGLPEGTLWRHAQAGDLPHKGGRIDRVKLLALVRANKGRKGFGYSHHNVLQSLWNARLIQSATLAGFTINLSSNNLRHADQLADAGLAPVVTVLPRDVVGNVEIRTPKGRRVVVCPATYREDTTCKSCGLCQVAARGVIVGFPAHGAGAKRAGAIASLKH